MNTACYVCAEVRAGQNRRELEWLLSPVNYRRHHIEWNASQLRECRFCRRTCCHVHSWQRYYRSEGNWTSVCDACYSLQFTLSGRSQYELDVGNAGPSFRKLWRLYRWRVTKRRLVDRLRISRVVERQLPKDLANLVATYAVK